MEADSPVYKSPDNKVIKLIVRRPHGELEAEPDSPEEVLFFHPLPKDLIGKVKEGDIWEGHYGRLWDTNKQDVSGRKILIRYFIPETLITGGVNG